MASSRFVPKPVQVVTEVLKVGVVVDPTVKESISVWISSGAFTSTPSNSLHYILNSFARVLCLTKLWVGTVNDRYSGTRS